MGISTERDVLTTTQCAQLACGMPFVILLVLPFAVSLLTSIGVFPIQITFVRLFGFASILRRLKLHSPMGIDGLKRAISSANESHLIRQFTLHSVDLTAYDHVGKTILRSQWPNGLLPVEEMLAKLRKALASNHSLLYVVDAAADEDLPANYLQPFLEVFPQQHRSQFAPTSSSLLTLIFLRPVSFFHSWIGGSRRNLPPCRLCSSVRPAVRYNADGCLVDRYHLNANDGSALAVDFGFERKHYARSFFSVAISFARCPLTANKELHFTRKKRCWNEDVLTEALRFLSRVEIDSCCLVSKPYSRLIGSSGKTLALHHLSAVSCIQQQLRCQYVMSGVPKTQMRRDFALADSSNALNNSFVRSVRFPDGESMRKVMDNLAAQEAPLNAIVTHLHISFPCVSDLQEGISRIEQLTQTCGCTSYNITLPVLQRDYAVLLASASLRNATCLVLTGCLRAFEPVLNFVLHQRRGVLHWVSTENGSADCEYFIHVALKMFDRKSCCESLRWPMFLHYSSRHSAHFNASNYGISCRTMTLVFPSLKKEASTSSGVFTKVALLADVVEYHSAGGQTIFLCVPKPYERKDGIRVIAAISPDLGVLK